MNDSLRQTRTTHVNDPMHCPSCSHADIRSTPTQHSFTYGTGEAAVELTAIVDVRRCENCDFEFIDDSAEDAKHKAICRHLGVLTPAEIRALRNDCGMTRARFSQLTKIGEATLGRWERGSLIQSAAYDQYLFLLGFGDNRNRLLARAGANETPQVRTRPSVEGDSSRFRILQDDAKVAEMRRRAAKFRLHVYEAA